MDVKIVEELGEPVGLYWRELQTTYSQTKRFSVAVPLSGTPLPIYRWVTEYARSFASWDNVDFVLMDEQVEGVKPPFTYISTQDRASYERFARTHFLEPLERQGAGPLNVVKPPLSDINDCAIETDFLILALGVKGNYANVMPGTPIDTGWHIAHLLPEFCQAHTQSGSLSYEGATFRDYGVSLGPQQVLAAKNVAVIISGSKKSSLTKELLSYKDFDPHFPLSIIHHEQLRDRVQLYITDDVELD